VRASSSLLSLRGERERRGVLVQKKNSSSVVGLKEHTAGSSSS
jgi:hypothetical protein